MSLPTLNWFAKNQKIFINNPSPIQKKINSLVD